MFALFVYLFPQSIHHDLCTPSTYTTNSVVGTALFHTFLSQFVDHFFGAEVEIVFLPMGYNYITIPTEED